MNTSDIQPTHAGTHGIIFFDGVCNLCNFWVYALFQLDSHKNLLFAPLQGKTAGIRLPPEMAQNNRSIVFYKKGRIFTGAGAIVQIARSLPFPWRLLSLAGFFPAFLNEGVYRLVASNRYKLFGKRDSCSLPGNKEKERFLD